MHKKIIYPSIISICICTTVYAGFLKPAKFPATTADLSFVSQTQNKTDGYMPYAGLSPYQIIQLEEMEDVAYSAIEQELINAGIDTCENCDESGNSQPQDGSTIITTPEIDIVIPQPPRPEPTPNKPEQPQQPHRPEPTPISGYCSRRNPGIHAGQKIPFGLPVNTAEIPANASKKTQSIVRNTERGLFCSPYGCERGRPHQGVDIGCTADFYQMPIYATADGKMEYETTRDEYLEDFGKTWNSDIEH
jgi:hypothetical protein